MIVQVALHSLGLAAVNFPARSLAVNDVDHYWRSWRSVDEDEHDVSGEGDDAHKAMMVSLHGGSKPVCPSLPFSRKRTKRVARQAEEVH